MEINIIPVEISPPSTPQLSQISTEPVPVSLESLFTQFIDFEVGDGAASPDTIRSYISQTKQYLTWCQDNLIPPKDADSDDIKYYRQWLVQNQYATATISHKLNVIRRFYQALLTKGLVTNNPAIGIKAPRESVDPASRITFLELEELQLLLDHIETELNQAKTQKKKLTLYRDRILVGIMSLEGCRTIEIHQLKIEHITKQGANSGLKVSAKRASRIVPLTDNLRSQLDEYLEIRRKVIRRKIKPTDYVFVSLSNNNKGKQLSRNGIRSIVDGYLVATNLKHTPGRTLSAHSLRHTAGTLALRSGASLRQVQDLLGHSDPRMTSIYAHIGDRWSNNPAAGIEEQLR